MTKVIRQTGEAPAGSLGTQEESPDSCVGEVGRAVFLSIVLWRVGGGG